MRVHILLLLATGCLAACGKSPSDVPVPEGAGVAKGQSEVQAAALHVLDYGPKEVPAGVPFNAQPDGSSAMWFKMDQNLEGSLVNVHLGGQVFHGDISGQVVTVKVPNELHEQPGVLPVSVDKVDGTKVVKSNLMTLTLGKP